MSRDKETEQKGGQLERRRTASLAEGHGETGPLGVLEAVHGAQLGKHVQAVGEDEHHNQGGDETHPDARREEGCTVTGV